MRIPLDYYRILGLPIQASPEQISQAYRDRTLQLPRREYSEVAIASRKQLLDEAYEILSEPEDRSAYDSNFLTKTYDQEPDQALAAKRSSLGVVTNSNVSSHTPSIEIQDQQFVGVLLILQELGEYELVLKLGQPYLSSNDSISLDKGSLGDPQLVRADIVLTLALACLELGREQWQQGQYENAATSLETGQELLLREGLFPSVRGEIQADLYKLRPYRILELLALPDANINERRNGLRLLQDMLQERGGIDGNADDQSGLGIDDFLRFIQQLRGYLTAAEQQNLFETEARRPSAVATYLAVYALLARGFAQRQPSWIARGKQLLMRLSKRQDVHLEQAVCALLLGQTEEASKALELSQEYEPLAFIREHSQGSPDLLPGLCLYGERWLQNSVFTHFRDLADQKASLKEYFADEQVQAYLENLSDATEETQDEWAVVESQKKAYATTVPPRVDSGKKLLTTDKFPLTTNEAVTVASPWTREPATVTASRTNYSADIAAKQSPVSSVSSIPTAQRIAPTPTVRDSKVTSFPHEKLQHRLNQPRSSSEGMTSGSTPRSSVVPEPSSGGVSPDGLTLSNLQLISNKSRPFSKTRRSLLPTLLILIALGVLGLFLIRSLIGRKTPELTGEQPQVELEEPPVEIPESDSSITAPEGLLTEETAKQVIQTWLSTKNNALGTEYQVEQLAQILVDPSLSNWQQRAQETKQNGAYWEYQHEVEVNSVITSDDNPDQATADAAVKEVGSFYQNGELNQAQSYDENLRVRYNLVRQEGQWFIRDVSVY
ncbi:MAG: DUF4101 domain-containing protein [Symploca sp. SIO2E6]|nr:DUF4101 domain-containing protein [Symploca sp. SIO2E6]